MIVSDDRLVEAIYNAFSDVGEKNLSEVVKGDHILRLRARIAYDTLCLLMGEQEPIATVINNNQAGWENIIETKPNVTLVVGTKLYLSANINPVELLESRAQVARLREAKHCHLCQNEGYTTELDPKNGEPYQVECEFCFTNPKSLFNVLAHLPEQSARDAEVLRLAEELVEHPLEVDTIGWWQQYEVLRKAVRRDKRELYR